ncbi:MAG: Gfo/Idh/MocA family oxidoreductase [Desulfobacterales bacterium]
MPKPLKVGLVGTGRIAHAHMAAYLQYPDQVKLTAVCDIIEDAAQQYAKTAKVDAVYTDYETMLKEADIDAVDICSIHDQHPAQTVAAAEAGKHVLTEKAMAHTLQGCRDMIEATDKAGVTLMVAQNLRYVPDSVAVKQLIDKGELGTIQAVCCHAIMKVVGANPVGHWMNDGKQAGGGILMTNTIHHVDLLRYYIGNAKRVTGICKTVQPEMVNGAEDLVAATLEFENGAIGDVFGNWTTFRSPEAMSYKVFGTKGTLHSTPPKTPEQGLNQFGTILISTKDRDKKGDFGLKFEPVETTSVDLPSSHCFVNEILHFEECCREGKEPISSGRDNIETIKMLMAIYESSRTGKAVDVDSM